MDNTYLQIGLGLVPSVIFFVVLLLFREKNKTRNIVALISLALVLVLGFIMHFTSNKEPKLKMATSADTLKIIYAVSEAGNVEFADQMLQELRETEPMDNTFTLCAARLYALQANFKASKTLYEKCMNTLTEDITEEYDDVCAAADAERTDHTLLAHFDTDRIQPATEEGKAKGQAVETVIDAISDTVNSRVYTRAAELMASSTALYQEYISHGIFDVDEGKDQLRRINNFAGDYPDLFSLSPLRIARLKLQILCEDYEGIAENVDEKSNYNELLIVSELYLNNYIRGSYFSETYIEDYDAKCGLVAEQLETVYDSFFVDENSSVGHAVQKQIESLEYASENPALARIEDGLLEYTRHDNAYDSTKVYLQLAKIENQAGNETKSERYLDASLNTVGDCEDSNFTQPMYDIIGIISDKDDPEKLKDVAIYVDRILNNNMPIEMSEEHTTPAPETPEDKPDRDIAEKPDAAEGFNSYLTDYVSKKRASVNIVSVDTSDFSKIQAVINVDDSISYTADELAQILSIRDCGADITDYSVEKVEYKGANILLCCDVSGSMGGTAIESLKNAISIFVANSSEIVNIALVTFNSYIDEVYAFGTPSDTLLAAAQSLYANGGTDMYAAVMESINMFELRPGELNCIILLSDGEDNDYRSSSDINEYIGRPCVEKGITLYSIGLGHSVDAEYLNYFAASTGGNYLYVNDPETLHSFYNDLHNRILNQYVITFEAEDTLSIDRTLKVTIESDSLSYDIARYSLQDDSDNLLGSEDEAEDGLIFLQEKWVSGLDTRFIYKSQESYNINLLGSGFEDEDQISVELKGNLDYDSDKITCEFKDENTVLLTIPAGVACGTYDVHVSINGKKAILDNELTVATQGSEKTTVFGPYVFTSYSKIKDGDTITLSGYVNLNGWLNFTDEVLLTGDPESSQLLLSEHSGGYIRYYEDTSEGLASYFANNKKVLNISPIGQLMLYNDTAHDPSSDDYKVEAALLPGMYFSNVLTIASPGLMLYPDRIVMDATAFTTDFPFQNKLLKSSGLTEAFSFDLELQCLLTSKNIGINLEYGSESDTKEYSPVNFGKMPIYFSPSNFELKINTIDNAYFVKYIVKVAFIDSDGLGFSLKWDGSLVPTEVRLYADFELTTNINGVPVTFSDFMLGVTGIDINKNVLHWQFEGSMSAAGGKVSAVFPKLDKFVGDLSVVEFKDATLKFSLGQRYIGVSTDVKLFGIDIAKASLDAGNFKYTNRLLNMADEDAKGIRANLTLGIMWDSKKCDIELTGDVEFAACNKFLGVKVTGTCDIEIDWWVFKKGIYAHGTALVGVYTDHKGKSVFTVRSQSQSSTISVVWSDGSGLDYSSDII